MRDTPETSLLLGFKKIISGSLPPVKMEHSKSLTLRPLALCEISIMVEL
jgi:hypothetical protein